MCLILKQKEEYKIAIIHNITQPTYFQLIRFIFFVFSPYGVIFFVSYSLKDYYFTQ